MIKQRETAFKALDKDNNRSLSLTEFNAVVAAQPIKTDTAAVLAQLDTNKDGQISLIEHRAGKLPYFDQIDLDKDGVVSAAEMKAAGVIK